MDEVDGGIEDKEDGVDDKKNVDVIKCEKRDKDQNVKVEVKEVKVEVKEVKVEVKEECLVSLEEIIINKEEIIVVKEESMQEENVKDLVKVEDGVSIK